MAINKVIYGNNTLIDLTADTTTYDKVLTGYTFHDATGEIKTGSCTYDVDSSDCTAVIAEVLNGKIFASNGTVLTGTMPNNGSINQSINTVAGKSYIPQGYHNGTGYVQIDATEQAKIIAGNIKKDTVILGVTGTYEGAAIQVQTKSATPTFLSQTITPDTGYNYLEQVNLAAIPYSEVINSAGGKTATFG